MLNKIKRKFKNNTEIIALGLLLLTTILSTTYYNFNKQKIYNNYKNIINNVYFKKTLNHFIDRLEPRFKKISHKIQTGETFNSILEKYSIKQKDIFTIKNTLSKKVNLDKLNTDQKIYLTIDQTDNTIIKFLFQISNKERIILTQDLQNKSFSQEILLTKLKKEIVYKENTILQSLYKSAINKNIPANVITEFARVYGFQVDFQRDIKKQDKFQIIFETYLFFLYLFENQLEIHIS